MINILRVKITRKTGFSLCTTSVLQIFLPRLKDVVTKEIRQIKTAFG